ncbi:unnamed protein product [Hyaloperonospora brassicae]|uniref:Cation efflux protein cytoplasmic domain-containing protein n=1 Tax=Hyaloperonospora brassicae TaxID=162125 RepID=A0AAV0TBA8_HYABA|nr:unnamed protein product [Hyaloperonospora brassicae]
MSTPAAPLSTVAPDKALQCQDDHVVKLQLACLCSFLFLCVQLAGGYYTDSLAILSDAAHVLSDVASFLVSLVAMSLGQLPASATMPFGYHRAEVIGALGSVLLVWVLAIGLLWTALQRVYDQGQGGEASTDLVDGKTMFVVAMCGLGINLVLMKILGHDHCHGHGAGQGHDHCHGHGAGQGPCRDGEATSVGTASSVQDRGRTPMSAMALIDGVEIEPLATEVEKLAPKSSVFENINVRAAYIHALGDFVQSLGVCLAGGLIWYNPSWQMADPITTILFSFLVLATTVGVLTRSVHILMEGAPPALDLRVVEKRIRALASVYDVHDLHVWMLTEGHYAASVHILPTGEPRVALRATQCLLASLGVRQQTVQVEDPTDRDWNEDLYCSWVSHSNVALEAESKMSVPRAGTKKAALEPLPGTAATFN